jgi:hypothetical protein
MMVGRPGRLVGLGEIPSVIEANNDKAEEESRNSARDSLRGSVTCFGFLMRLDMAAAQAFEGPSFRLDRIHPHLAAGTMGPVVARDDVHGVEMHGD